MVRGLKEENINFFNLKYLNKKLYYLNKDYII